MESSPEKHGEHVGDSGSKHVIVTNVERRELKRLRKMNLDSQQIDVLGKFLDYIYVVHLPKPSDYHHRSSLVLVFNSILKEIYGSAGDFGAVQEFGSFIMDMFAAQSDLDLSINFNKTSDELPRREKVKILRVFARSLYTLQARGHLCNMKPIFSARVPIIKVTDIRTGVECDISVENRDGITISHIIRIISGIDERFQKLSVLIKHWAKSHGINNASENTLNSLSVVLLVAFHLQTRDPPILPPFSAILQDGYDPASVVKAARAFSKYGEPNKESLADLFVTFFVKLASAEPLWSNGLCASVYEGSWIVKPCGSQRDCINIEDFTRRPQNVARAACGGGVKAILRCIQETLSKLTSFKEGEIGMESLGNYLFNPDTPSSPRKKGSKHARIKPTRPISNPVPRVMEIGKTGTKRGRTEPVSVPVPAKRMLIDPVSAISNPSTGQRTWVNGVGEPRVNLGWNVAHPHWTPLDFPRNFLPFVPLPVAPFGQLPAPPMPLMHIPALGLSVPLQHHLTHNLNERGGFGMYYHGR